MTKSMATEAYLDLRPVAKRAVPVYTYVPVYTDLSIRQTLFSTVLRWSSGYRLRRSGIVSSLLRSRHTLDLA